MPKQNPIISLLPTEDWSDDEGGETMPTNKNDSISGSYKDFGTKDEAAEAEREVATLAAASTKRIHCARLGVFLLITAFGALVSYYTYQILHSNEVASYEEGVSHAKTIGTSYGMS